MSKKKQGGKLVQRERPRPKYLGMKVSSGEIVKEGSVLVRQRGSKYLAGEGVEMGRDHTLFSLKKGKVHITKKNNRIVFTISTS